MKSKLEIYALSVCFASVVCIVISSGFLGYSLIGISAPEITMRGYTYEQYQSNEAYWDRNYRYYSDGNNLNKPSEEELTKKRAEAYKIELKNEKREGFQTLLRSLIFALAGSIALAIHWVIAKNARS